MGAPYSEDLRWKVVKAYEKEEGSMGELAQRFSVNLDISSKDIVDIIRLGRERNYSSESAGKP